MSSITRRTLGMAATGLLLGRPAWAEAEATRNLPKTYSGTTLNIVWGPEPVNSAMANFSKEFQDATGINIQ